jgi:uncharacterized protein (UPF0333 family)
MSLYYLFGGLTIIATSVFAYRAAVKIKRNIEFACTVYSMYKNIVLNTQQSKKEDDPKFTSLCDGIKINDNAAVITYNEGKNSLRVPYDADLVPVMINYEVNLMTATNNFVCITQEPGIPYLCTARQLGGEKIIVIDHENNTSYTYGIDDVPRFCEELLPNYFPERVECVYKDD